MIHCIIMAMIHRPSFIALVMEAVRAFETFVCYNETTRRNIPEGSNILSRRHENLQSHLPYPRLRLS
jgi:hypothetical protein